MDNDKLAKEIVQEVDKKKDEIIDFLAKLISFQSVTGNEGPIQEYISEYLKRLNLEVDIWEPDHEALKRHPAYVPVENGYENRPNVVGKLAGSGDGKSLLFNGHVDVIPAKPENWETDPWEAVVKDGKMYGRGASDMKAGDAAMTMAIKVLHDLGIEPKGDVFLEYVVDEEISGNGTIACIQRGYKADAGISCEAGDMEIQPATTGSMWFEIEVEGKSASMSRRWEAVSALDKGYMIARWISEFEEERIKTIKHPLYPDTRGSLACFVGMFNAGTYPSAPPARCIIKGRMGALPGEIPSEAQKSFINYILERAKRDPWLKDHPPKVAFKGYYAEPAEISSDFPLVGTIKKVYKTVMNNEAVVKGHDGAADTRFLINYGDTPTVIFGPGTISQMHADNEWVSVDNLINSVKILALTILEWCGY